MVDMNTLARELLLARFIAVRDDLNEALARIDQESLPWAPAPGMRTIQGLLLEIIATERQIVSGLRDPERMRFVEAEDLGASGDTLAGLQSWLEATRQQTLDYVKSLSQEELEAAVPVPPRSWEAMGQGAVPRIEVLRSVAIHESYHTGQLVSYLWMRGDDPYQW